MQVMKKLTDEEYNSMFVTSDTHFGHRQEFIYKQRGYDSPESMDVDMIHIINDTVGVDGILLHLGDFCLNTSRERYINILRQLKIKAIWMIWGNHNNPIQREYGLTQQQVIAYHGSLLIRYYGHYLTLRHRKNDYVCFHYPLQTWNGINQGSKHLCGHSHGNFTLSRPEDTTHKMLDCGWDVHNKPISLDHINDIMKLKGVEISQPQHNINT